MTEPYSSETQKILDGFLSALHAEEGLDRDFLAELQAMARTGTLASPSRIRRAIVRKNELDAYWQGSQ